LEFVLSLGSDPNKGLVDHRVTLIALSSQHAPEKQLELLAPLIRHGVDLNCLFEELSSMAIDLQAKLRERLGPNLE